MTKKVCYILTKKDSDKLNLHKLKNTKLLLKSDFEEFDYDFHSMLGWMYYPNFCFATIIDNKIVSCASAGYREKESLVNDKIIDISTITSSAHRGKGYSVSNVVALCEYVFHMRDMKEIHYITDVNNIASQRTAESAGLMKTRYCYIMLRKILAKLL